VLVTKVGEIPDYLTDLEDAFLSEPDSSEAFAEKLDFVLSNPELAREVGLKGRQLTHTVFNSKVQSQRIIEFIKSLNNNKSIVNLPHK